MYRKIWKNFDKFRKTEKIFSQIPKSLEDISEIFEKIFLKIR